MLVDQERKSAIVSKLHSILRPYLLRRTKDDVEKELPGKQEVILYAQMTPEQRKIQKGILDKSLMVRILPTIYYFFFANGQVRLAYVINCYSNRSNFRAYY